VRLTASNTGIRGDPRFRITPFHFLSVQVFNPLHGLGVGNLSEGTLSCRKIGMPQDHLTDNLDGNARFGGLGGGVPAEIVRPKGNVDHFSSFGHYHSRSLLGNRKNPILAGLTAFGGVFRGSVSNLLGMAYLLQFGFDFDGPTEIRIGYAEAICYYFQLLKS
jgi:hypothetical protein